MQKSLRQVCLSDFLLKLLYFYVICEGGKLQSRYSYFRETLASHLPKPSKVRPSAPLTTTSMSLLSPRMMFTNVVTSDTESIPSPFTSALSMSTFPFSSPRTTLTSNVTSVTETTPSPFMRLLSICYQKKLQL